MEVSNKTILEAVKDFNKARAIFNDVLAQERRECNHETVGEVEGETYRSYSGYDSYDRYPNKRICMKCGLTEELKYSWKILPNPLVYKLSDTQLRAIEKSARA